MTQVSSAAYVLDASVAVKWFAGKGEPDQDKALAIRQRFIHRACSLIVPTLFFVEMVSALRKQPSFDEQDVAQGITALEQLDLSSHTVDWALLRRANAISWRTGISIYDACYVALAEMCTAPLLTADEMLIRRIRGDFVPLLLRDLEIAGG